MAELLRCVDQWGRVVVLEEWRWKTHIVADHPEMRRLQPFIKPTVVAPHQVMHDTVFEDRENFYRVFSDPTTSLLVCIKVVVQYQTDDQHGTYGSIKTAYSCNGPKKRERQKWP